ncbi:hypothetical protein R1flu_010731 [Riccia fluitans]|uniref:Uncharacterized protein n=1 Tax=Riccia fluitans TaxID=41844 RepID=A0ABD1Z8A6_9MARC
MVPENVWKQEYADYVRVWPDSVFTEDTLKQRLRETLDEIETGRSNEKGGSTSLQSDNIFEKIRQTNGHATRNLLMTRSDIIQPAVNADLPEVSNKPKNSMDASPATNSANSNYSNIKRVVLSEIRKNFCIRREECRHGYQE